MRNFHYIWHKRPHELKNELIRILMMKGQDHVDLSKHIYDHNKIINILIMTKLHTNVEQY